MKRGAPIPRNPEMTRAWRDRSNAKAAANQRSKPRKPLKRSASKPKRQPISPASPEQREKVAGAKCIVCGVSGCDPAHLIDRSIGGDDDPRAVVALCRRCHRAYDEDGLSLLEYLEPDHRAELAYAVELVGMMAALRRITNKRWSPSA